MTDEADRGEDGEVGGHEDRLTVPVITARLIASETRAWKAGSLVTVAIEAANKSLVVVGDDTKPMERTSEDPTTY